MTVSPKAQAGEDSSQHWYEYVMGESSSSSSDDECEEEGPAELEQREQQPAELQEACGGLPDVVGDLPWVTEEARRAVARAVRTPPRWASARLRTSMTNLELDKAPYRHPPEAEASPRQPTLSAEQPAKPEGAPSGPIHISQLYLDGKYDALVVPWLKRAELAMEALEAGRDPPRIDKLVLEQDDMPEWARGIVWDTRDPDNCHPVRRSSQATWEDDFPGDKVDPTAIRREAERMGWHDMDIVDQIAGGGLEGRFTCSLSTVLAFHHQGVVKPPRGLEHCEASSVGAGFKQVDKVVQEDVRRQWMSGGTGKKWLRMR